MKQYQGQPMAIGRWIEAKIVIGNRKFTARSPGRVGAGFHGACPCSHSWGGNHASATSIGAVDVPQMHTASVCKNVKSSGNWNGTICAIVNLDDATGWTTGQALITYSIKSGTLKIVSAKSLYTNVSTPICH
jgi:hypothetical protein